MTGEILFVIFIIICLLILIVEIQNLRVISILKNEHHDRINIIEEALNKEGINAGELRLGKL